MSFKISVIVPAYNAEDYLAETLDSLVNQTFRDFEVIIINDGSTDKTQEIIDKYSKEYSNFRSFIQPNSGVSKARNKGIDEAHGDYIAFLDSDDLFTPKALEKLYKAAFENNAELVIGIAGHFNLFGRYIHKNTVKLSNKKNIDPFEKSLIWSFSQCNKLFLRRKIIETKIRFPNLKYAEDGSFVLRFAYRCNKITGCPHKVAFYRKHDFWEGISATQKTDVEYITDYLKAHKLIYNDAVKGLKYRIKKAKTPGEKAEATTNYYEYLDELLYRRVSILFNEFYRLFWKTDNNSLELIKDIVLSIKTNIYPSTWLKLKDAFPDLFIDNLIYNRSLMAENPIISIILDPKEISENDLLLMLDSIYAQDFPAFEILIPEKISDKLSNGVLQKENLHLIDSENKDFKNVALKKSKGKYALFIENSIILNPNTLKIFFNTLNDENFDMVSTEIGRLSDYELSEYLSQELAYSYRNTVNNSRKSKFNYLDLYLSNKLIKIDFLRKVGFKFSGDSASDVKKLYDNAKFKKLSEKYIFSTKDEKELINSLKSYNKFIMIKISFLNIFKKSLYVGLKSRRFVKHKLMHNIKNKFKKNIINTFIRLFKILPLRNRVFFYSIRSNNKLLENSLYVYNSLNVNKHFIVKMLPHSNKTQLKILYYLITSKVIVTDDYLRYLRQVKLKKGQKMIQLWHACGAFKKFSLDHPSMDIETEIKTHSQYTDVLVSSEYVRKYYASAFGLSIDKIKALGVPRSDMFFDEENKKAMLNDLYKEFPQLKNKKIILYCPTFRENGKNQRIPLNTKINWENLNASLKDNELLVIRKHPVMEEDLLNGNKYDKILDLSSASTYALMFASDLMITDYSSVIFEYSLLNKPMLFYCPDEYTRDFYLNYPEDLPGAMICNYNDLIKEIQSVLTNLSLSDLKDFKMKFMNSCDGNSTKRVVNLIESHLSKNKGSLHDLTYLSTMEKGNSALNLDNASLKNVELDKLSEEQNINNLK